jgi:folate-binding protein YgfZ
MLDTPLNAIEQSSGARFAEYFGCRMPTLFSDFPTDYGHLRHSVALVDKTYRAWFRFTGPDRARFLNAILTNNIKDLPPGQALPALLLNPQGHILAELDTLVFDDHILAASYAMIRERLAADFDRYIIMDDVTMQDVTDEFSCMSLEGPRAAVLTAKVTGIDLNALADLAHAAVNVDGIACLLQRRSPGGIASAEFLVERNHAEELWTKLADALKAEEAVEAAGPSGYIALSAVRLEQGIPWFGYDYDDTTIPQEAGLEITHINFSKGCYTGQEIVERVRSRGHVNHRLAGLSFSTDEPPQPGTKLFAAEKEAGRITRAAFSPLLGSPIGFARLRREYTTIGTQLDCTAGNATVIELPITSPPTLQK